MDNLPPNRFNEASKIIEEKKDKSCERIVTNKAHFIDILYCLEEFKDFSDTNNVSVSNSMVTTSAASLAGDSGSSTT